MGVSLLHKNVRFRIALGLALGCANASAITCQEALALARSRGLGGLVRDIPQVREGNLPHDRDQLLVATKDEPVRRGTPSVYPFGTPGAKYNQRVKEMNADPKARTMPERAANVRRYQEAHNRLGPIVLQYTHNLLAQAARLQKRDTSKKVKIAFLIEDGTASYEMAKVLLARFKNQRDNPYEGLDLDNLKLVPVTDKMLDDATERAKVPKVLAGRFGGELATDGVIGRNDRVILGGLGITRRGEAYNLFAAAVRDAGGTFEERLVAFNPSEAKIDGLRGVCINCKEKEAREDLDAMLARDDVKISRRDLENEITKFYAHILQGTNKDDVMPASITVKRGGGVEITGTDKKPYEYFPVTPTEKDPEKYLWGGRMLAYKDLANETPLETLRELEDSGSTFSRMVRLHFVTHIAQQKKAKEGEHPNPEAPIGLETDDNT